VIHHGVTKRCCLSRLTNSALLYEPNYGGRGELWGLSQWAQLYTGVQINLGCLTPYLTYWIHTARPCILWWKVITLHVHTSSDKKWYILHVYTAGSGKWYILHGPTAECGKTPCTSILLVLEVVKEIPTARPNACSGKAPFTSIDGCRRCILPNLDLSIPPSVPESVFIKPLCAKSLILKLILSWGYSQTSI
jgi:hypothetical protein